MINQTLTPEHVILLGFEKINSIGWTKYRKGNFELVEIHLVNGKTRLGFEYVVNMQTKYRVISKIEDLELIYEFIIGEKL